jgi:hypothetical protein
MNCVTVNKNKMQRQIKKGDEYELFPPTTYSLIVDTIANEITSMSRIDDHVLGAIIMKDLVLMDGSKVNGYIEFNASKIEGGLIDCGVHDMVIFDEIPDEVLDKYNKLKSIIDI